MLRAAQRKRARADGARDLRSSSAWFPSVSLHRSLGGASAATLTPAATSSQPTFNSSQPTSLTTDAWARLGARSGALAGNARGRFAPELLEAIELACLGGEDVHDHVEVVHQDPAPVG